MQPVRVCVCVMWVCVFISVKERDYAVILADIDQPSLIGSI